MSLRAKNFHSNLSRHAFTLIELLVVIAIIKRRAMKIACCPAIRERKPVWNPEEIALLGTVLDVEVARRTGHSVSAIATRCAMLGIELKQRGNRPWTVAEKKLLGTGPDQEIAARMNRSIIAVTNRRAILKVPIWRPS